MAQRLIGQIAGGSFSLILVYLIFKNPKAVNDLITTSSAVANRQIAALQGR